MPSALPANTRDVCVALGLVCACSCEQETLSSRIPAKTWNLKHGLYKYLDISYMLEKWSLKGLGNFSQAQTTVFELHKILLTVWESWGGVLDGSKVSKLSLPSIRII